MNLHTRKLPSPDERTTAVALSHREILQSKRRGCFDCGGHGNVSHSTGNSSFFPLARLHSRTLRFLLPYLGTSSDALRSDTVLSQNLDSGHGHGQTEEGNIHVRHYPTFGMFDRMRNRYYSAQRRLRRLERRELRHLRRWLEDTENVLHLSSLVIVPIVIGAITLLSNVSPAVSFLVYPPLASGTYTLFADPGGRYSSPRKFVGGMTVGALSGWIALEAGARFWYAVPPEQFQVNAAAAALGIFLTGAVTWTFELEEPTAFSSALLVLVTGSGELLYVAGIAVSSLLVAGVFVAWHRYFYQERARYLFQSTRGDDQVLVSVRGEDPETLATFAARIAAAHDAGKVVLMTTVPPEAIEEKKPEMTAETPSTDQEHEEAVAEAEEQVTKKALDELEHLQHRIEENIGITCEFVVAVEDASAGETVLKTAETENCDLIVSPYETEDGELAPFVQTVLKGDTDTIVFRPSGSDTEWHRALVMVRSPGEIANSLLDFANRLAAGTGRISACTCISREKERRSAERMLENVVGTISAPIETRIAHGSVEEFLRTNTSNYDIAFIGASTDRSAASRFLSVPTFERVRDIECDLAIVDTS